MKRMGAGSYLLSMSSATLIWCVLVRCRIEFDQYFESLLPGMASLLLGIATVIFGCLFFVCSAKRLRDLNFPTWTVKVLAFPLIAVILLPLLCGLSGSRWDNDFGEAPPASSWGKVALALFLFVLAFNFAYTTGREYFLFSRSQAAPVLQPMSEDGGAFLLDSGAA